MRLKENDCVADFAISRHFPLFRNSLLLRVAYAPKLGVW
jgi:hypothetical protein